MTEEELLEIYDVKLSDGWILVDSETPLEVTRSCPSATVVAIDRSSSHNYRPGQIVLLNSDGNVKLGTDMRYFLVPVKNVIAVLEEKDADGS